jgi:hypothetical protein
MPNRSYGIVILFLALISFVPVVGVVSRLIIMLLALQIIWGRPSPALPQRLMARKFSSRHLTRIPAVVFSSLHYMERYVRPRWHSILGGRRLSGTIVFLACLISLLLPIPFANVPAAAIVMLMALAYLEHDGLFLVLAQIAGLAMIVFTSVIIMGAVRW